MNLLKKENVIGVIVTLIFITGIFRSCFVVKDKIGFTIPLDKEGRQIFIQSLDYYWHPAISVTSDFDEYNIFQKIWISPMRTTIKLKLTQRNTAWNDSSIDKILNLPTDSLLVNDNADFDLGEDRKMPMSNLKQVLIEKKILNFKQLIENMGFEKIIFIDYKGSEHEKKLTAKSYRLI